MKPATAVSGSFPFLGAILAITALGAAPLRASQILIQMRVPTLTLSHGTDPEGVDDLTLLVDVDNHGPGAAGNSVSMLNGETIHPDWLFQAEIEPRGRASYKVPIRMTLDDFDPPEDGVFPGGTVTHLDINPGPGRALNMEFDMATGLISSPGAKTGDELEAQATVEYAFTSNPFLYEFAFYDLTKEISPGLWSYAYAVQNSDLSTFDISGILIPGLWDLKPRLEPGFEFAIPATVSGTPPGEVFATVAFDDLLGTNKQVRVLAPVAIASVPEPDTFVLYGMCAGAGCMLLGMLRKKPIRNSGELL